MIITPQLIKVMAPDCSDPDTVSAKMNQFLPGFSINTQKRVLHFIAQLGHESSLNPIPENLNYSAQGLLKTFPMYFTQSTAADYARQPARIANRVYADRMGNGPESSGDGYRYRGRGFIQLTGKNNYVSYGTQLKLDLVGNPDLLLQIGVGIQVAARFFINNGIIQYCDANNIYEITRRINGGQNGIEDRLNRYQAGTEFLAKLQKGAA